MPSTRDFFLKESDEYVGGLRKLTTPDAPGDGAELRRLSRALRGCAQMAREDSVFRGARVLEAAAREVAEGRIAWDDEARGRVEATLDDLWALIEAGEADAPAALAVERLSAIRARWAEAGVEVGEEQGPQAPAAERKSGQAPPAALREYAAREVGGILDAVNEGVRALRADGRDRDALRSILLRQRALMGAAGLAGLPAVSDPLHVMDEIARLAASQDRSVEGPWLEVFELARAALEEAAGPLAEGRVPAAETPTLERLRQLRQRLVEGRGNEAAEGEVEEEIPVEVVNFFRTEARTRLEKLRRVADELEADPGRGDQLRPQLEEALTALAHTAGTFGFVAVGREVERAAARVASLPAGDAGVLIAALEGAIEAALARSSEEAGGTGDLPEMDLADLGMEAEPEAGGRERTETVAASEDAAGATAAAASGDVADTRRGAASEPGVETAEPSEEAGETAAAPAPATASFFAPPEETRAAGPAPSSAGQPSAPAPSAPAADGEEPVVPIEELCYRGEAALQRALALRAELEGALTAGAPTAPLMDEIFDLIRLGLR